MSWYLTLPDTGGGRRFKRAILISSGSSDAGEMARLGADGKYDISVIPTSALGGMQVQDFDGAGLGTVTTIREGANIALTVSGSVVTIASLAVAVQSIFDPVSNVDMMNIIYAWRPV